MNVIWFSKTGNVKRFVEKINDDNMNILNGAEEIADEPFLLITYNAGMGQVPEEVDKFLRDHSRNLIGVATSGNRNWGSYFGKAGDTISNQYDVPIFKFEMSGTKEDVEKFKEFLSNLKEDFS